MLHRSRPPVSQAPTAFTYAPPPQLAFPAVTSIAPRAYAPPANGGKTLRDPSPSAGGDFSGRQRLDDAKRGVERLRDGAPFFEVIPSRNRSGNTMVRIGTLIFPATDVNRHAEQNGGCLLPFMIRSSFGNVRGEDYDSRRMSLCACPGAAAGQQPSLIRAHHDVADGRDAVGSDGGRGASDARGDSDAARAGYAGRRRAAQEGSRRHGGRLFP
jgi:hypothetical protein